MLFPLAAEVCRSKVGGNGAAGGRSPARGFWHEKSLKAALGLLDEKSLNLALFPDYCMINRQSKTCFIVIMLCMFTYYAVLYVLHSENLISFNRFNKD